MQEFEFTIQDVVTGEDGTARVQLEAIGGNGYRWSCTARVGEREVVVPPRSTEIHENVNRNPEYLAGYIAGPSLRDEAFEFKREPPLDG